MSAYVPATKRILENKMTIFDRIQHKMQLFKKFTPRVLIGLFKALGLLLAFPLWFVNPVAISNVLFDLMDEQQRLENEISTEKKKNWRIK